MTAPKGAAAAAGLGLRDGEGRSALASAASERASPVVAYRAVHTARWCGGRGLRLPAQSALQPLRAERVVDGGGGVGSRRWRGLTRR
jgi:hypothetical protein